MSRLLIRVEAQFRQRAALLGEIVGSNDRVEQAIKQQELEDLTFAHTSVMPAVREVHGSGYQEPELVAALGGVGLDGVNRD